MPKFSLLIASAFYEVKAYSPYITSLMSTLRVLEMAGVPYSYCEISGDSYVDRAKNAIVDKFLASSHTHLMIIDSDLGWDTEGFGRLLKAALSGAEVVAGAYVCKGEWDNYAVSPVTLGGEFVGNKDSGSLAIQAMSFPGGFVIYSREAFERTRPVLKTYDMDGPVLECFRCDITDNGVRLGEDIYFQRKYTEQGGKLYIIPDITITHYGTKGFEGNYDRYIKRRPGGPQYPVSIERLRHKHLNETAWIIGKGASLAQLTKQDIGDGPVIAISEAIIPVEGLGLSNPVYALQKDADPPDENPIAPPKKATLLVQEREVRDRHKDYKPRYIFDNPIDFDAPWNTTSANTALLIAQLFGCKKMVLVAFDACTKENYDTCHYNADGTCEIRPAAVNPKEEGVGWRQYRAGASGLKNYIQNKFLCVEWLTPGEQPVQAEQPQVQLVKG